MLVVFCLQTKGQTLGFATLLFNSCLCFFSLEISQNLSCSKDAILEWIIMVQVRWMLGLLYRKANSSTKNTKSPFSHNASLSQNDWNFANCILPTQ